MRLILEKGGIYTYETLNDPNMSNQMNIYETLNDPNPKILLKIISIKLPKKTLNRAPKSYFGTPRDTKGPLLLLIYDTAL